MAGGGVERIGGSLPRHDCETLANPSKTRLVRLLLGSTSCGNRPVRRAKPTRFARVFVFPGCLPDQAARRRFARRASMCESSPRSHSNNNLARSHQCTIFSCRASGRRVLPFQVPGYQSDAPTGCGAKRLRWIGPLLAESSPSRYQPPGATLTRKYSLKSVIDSRNASSETPRAMPERHTRAAAIPSTK